MKFNLLDILLPKETKFYVYLNEQVAIFTEAAQYFNDFVKNVHNLSEEEIKKQTELINECENQGDKKEHLIIDELDKTFITPLDREDIHTITLNIDRCLDLLRSIMLKIETYKIRKMPVNIIKFSDLIVTMAVELKNIVENLEKKDRIMDLGKLIHRYENEADRLFHESLGELVSESHNPVEIIKFKELYERLERLTDSIDTVGKVIRGVRVKFG